MELKGEELTKLMNSANKGQYVIPTFISCGGIFELKLECLNVDFNNRVFFVFNNPSKRDSNITIEIEWRDLTKEFKALLVSLIEVR